jgi:hypothetical protein
MLHHSLPMIRVVIAVDRDVGGVVLVGLTDYSVSRV